MNNKEQLQKQADKLQEELDKLKQQIEECDKEQNTDRANVGEPYYYIDDVICMPIISSEDDGLIDDSRYEIGNYFKTEVEAKQHIKNLKTKMKLKRLAERLNNGVEIDWSNSSQRKFYLMADLYYRDDIELKQNHCLWIKASTIYCLDEDFLEIAKKEIGEQALIDYLKSGV